MKTVKSFNKATGKTYVYEVLENKWDPVKKRGAPTRRCIGHLDPATGELVPNGKRGPKKKDSEANASSSVSEITAPSDSVKCKDDSVNYKEMCDMLTEQIRQKDAEILQLKKTICEGQKLLSDFAQEVQALSASMIKESAELISAVID